MDIKNIVNGIILELSYFDADPMPTDELKDDFGLDSLKMVEMLLVLEETFDILINESDMDPEKLSTVQDLYDLATKYSLQEKIKCCGN